MRPGPSIPTAEEPETAQRAASRAPPTPGRLRDAVLFAALFVALEEGIVSSYLTSDTGAGLGVAAAAGALSTGLLALPAAVVAAPLGFALGRPWARRLGRHARAGLSGGRDGAEGVGVVLYAALLGVGVFGAYRAGVRVADSQSAKVATLVSTVSAVAATLGAAVVAAALAGPVGAVVLRGARAIPALARLPVVGLLLAVAGTVGLLLLVPPIYVNTPAACFVGLAVGPWLAARVRVVGRLAGTPLPRLFAAALGVSLIAGAALGRASGPVRLGVLERAPYASIVVTTLRRLVDRDHDGYSPILGGGDCDDADPGVHPGAINVPGNGLDEDCSGVDATPYTPPRPQRASGAPPRHDNVVLVHLDALRPDHVGFVGYRRPTTPKIDRFRQGATWFSRAYTPAPSTRFALASVMTGLEVERLPRGPAPDNGFVLLPEAVTLAERLGPLGYDRVGYTLSFVLGHVHGVGKGFRVWETPWPEDAWESARPDTARLTTDAATRYLADLPADGTRPFLLFLHYDCTHDPYVKHAAWDFGDGVVATYDSALAYCDDQLGRLFDTLDARGDKDRTAIILYSDHGELFGEHGLTNHGNGVFQPDVRVLLLARIPGGHVSEIDAPTVLTDLYPTLGELTGLRPDPRTQAWSLMPYLVGGEPMPHRSLYLYSELSHGLIEFVSRGVLDPDGRLKFIRDVSVGVNRLFDVEADPGELHDLSAARPDETRALEAAVEGWEAYERTP